jgi:4-hydroxy-tetrahydrodipicolinate reductase
VKILLIGQGKMGKLIASTAQAAGDEVVAMFGRENLVRLADTGKLADVVIDFSGRETLPAVCEYIRRTGTPLVSGTTGYSPEEKAALLNLGDSAAVLWSANFSIGVAVFYRLLRQISDTLKPDFDIELTETHHNQKADAPSGTAKLLLEAIDPAGEYTPVYGREGSCGKRDAKEIGVFALRGGTVAGTHTVHFFGPDEELEITHRASSRQIFVNGALAMARRMVGQPKGVYELQKLLFGEV